MIAEARKKRKTDGLAPRKDERKMTPRKDAQEASMQKINMVLNLFDGDAGAADGTAEGVENSADNGAENRNTSREAQIRGKELGVGDDLLDDYEKAFFGSDDGTEQKEQTENTETNTESDEDLDAEFDELVKGKYKDVYKKRTSSFVSDRLHRAAKETEELRSRAEKSDKILSLLAGKYGKSGTDNLDELFDAVKGDDDTWRQRAMDSGRSVTELQRDYDINEQQRQVENELESLRQFKAQTEMAQRFDGLIAKAQETYPSFDPSVEFDNPRFTAALDFIAAQREAENKAKGVNNEIYDLTYAYELAHADELRSNTIKRTVDATKRAVAHNIQANRSRPTENAAKHTTAAKAKSYFDMTDAEFDAFVEDVRNGRAKIG